MDAAQAAAYRIGQPLSGALRREFNHRLKEAAKNTALKWIDSQLKELDELIYSPEACTEGIGFSYDDVDLWARLRSLTVIKGAAIGPKTRAYLDYHEKAGDVPLYDVMAV